MKGNNYNENIIRISADFTNSMEFL